MSHRNEILQRLVATPKEIEAIRSARERDLKVREKDLKAREKEVARRERQTERDIATPGIRRALSDCETRRRALESEVKRLKRGFT